MDIYVRESVQCIISYVAIALSTLQDSTRPRLAPPPSLPPTSARSILPPVRLSRARPDLLLWAGADEGPEGWLPEGMLRACNEDSWPSCAIDAAVPDDCDGAPATLCGRCSCTEGIVAGKSCCWCRASPSPSRVARDAVWIWGAPVALEDGPTRACETAMDDDEVDDEDDDREGEGSLLAAAAAARLPLATPPNEDTSDAVISLLPSKCSSILSNLSFSHPRPTLK